MNTKIINIYNMWLQVIEEFRKNNKQILDLKFELHLAMYVQAILKDNISFHLNDDDIQIKKKEDNINLNQFYYWWSIERFNEILSEEEKIFNSFNELKEKVTKAIQNVKNPTIDQNDTDEDKLKKNEKINKNNDKIKKLEEHLKSEANKSNTQINSLKNFRLLYSNYDSIERFIKNIKIILQNK